MRIVNLTSLHLLGNLVNLLVNNFLLVVELRTGVVLTFLVNSAVCTILLV